MGGDKLVFVERSHIGDRSLKCSEHRRAQPSNGGVEIFVWHSQRRQRDAVKLLGECQQCGVALGPDPLNDLANDANWFVAGKFGARQVTGNVSAKASKI